MDEFMLPIFKEDDIYTELMKTHLNDRRIVLNGEIGDALVEEATLYIMQWNKEDRDRKIAPENRKPIYIYLNSLGGRYYIWSCFYEHNSLFYHTNHYYRLRNGCFYGKLYSNGVHESLCF